MNKPHTLSKLYSQIFGMMSYYKDTLCILSLLSCLFITFSLAGPVPNGQENGSDQKLIPTQISSLDSKVSLSSTVKGLRERPPSSYSLKMESFNTLMKLFTPTDMNLALLGSVDTIGIYESFEMVLALSKSKICRFTLTLAPKRYLKQSLNYDKVYVRAKLRVPNQFPSQSNTVLERPLDNWFSAQTIGWGYADFMPLSDLRDSSKGFVVNDMLVVQVAMEAISSTKYLPSYINL